MKSRILLGSCRATAGGIKPNDALFWIATLAGAVLMAGLLWLIDLKWLHDSVQRLNGLAVFILIVVLPLMGMPVSVLFAATGARFGAGWAFVLTALAIALHLILSWCIAHSWLKRPLEVMVRKLRRRKPELREGEHVPVSLLVALLPGMPYALKNYLLVLAGVPFRKLFCTCLPAHLFHASLAIFFGEFTAAMNTPKIIFLVTYAVLLVGVGHLVVRRLKRRTGAGSNFATRLLETPDPQ